MAPDDDQESGDDGSAPDGDGSPADRADPFDDLAEDVGDREGDPFETLAGDADGDGEDPGADDAGSERVTDATADPTTGDESPDVDGPAAEPTTGGPADPFADIPSSEGTRDDQTGDTEEGPRTTMGPARAGTSDAGSSAGETGSQGGTRRGDPFESAESAFEEMDVGDLDPDQVWQELDDAEARGSVSEVRERIYAEVSKHAYCEGCEWFSGPPEVSCGHEGTEILEFVDMETVRVVDCPIVEERRQLQEGE